MEKQTIIVMSDSHGNRAIVEEIKHRYLGKVDAILILSCLVMMKCGKEFTLWLGTWISMVVIQTV